LETIAMKTTLRIACFAVAVVAGSLVALAQQTTADPELTKFREAYTQGDGLAYVVIRDEKGERIYRYGDASRLTAKKDQRGYMLFTCAAPHVFLTQKPEDKAALQNAEVVKAGDPRFAELDSKYLAGCRNPLVKSAISKKAS
jgi:hypothetical protein